MALAQEREELTRQREEAGEFLKLKETWETQPHLREAIVRNLANQAGINLTQGQAVTQPSGYEDMTPNERRLYDELQSLRTRDLGQVSATLGEVKGLLGKITERDRLDAAITAARVNLRTSLGVEVSADEIKEAVGLTKIGDPEAAWLKVNAPRLAKGFADKGAAGAVGDKPNTPTGQAKTFDPYEPSLTADAINDLISQGYTPTSGPTHLIPK